MRSTTTTTPSHAIRALLMGAAIAVGAVALTGMEAAAQQTAPPGGQFQKVSELVELPEFVPGLGVLYVNPETLPAGPFLAYDRSGQLVSTIYMVSMDAMNREEAFTGLDAASPEVRHVDFRYNAGHPGLDEPHYHVILWHVPEEKASSLGG